MIKSFMIGYLQRRGYIVLENHVPMMLISGGIASSIKGCDKKNWFIDFPIEPYIVAINNAVVL